MTHLVHFPPQYGSPGGWYERRRRDEALLVTCDHVATLPDWQKSKGAVLEVYLAGRLGISDSTAHTITEYQVQPCSSL